MTTLKTAARETRGGVGVPQNTIPFKLPNNTLLIVILHPQNYRLVSQYSKTYWANFHSTFMPSCGPIWLVLFMELSRFAINFVFRFPRK